MYWNLILKKSKMCSIYGKFHSLWVEIWHPCLVSLGRDLIYTTCQGWKVWLQSGPIWPTLEPNLPSLFTPLVKMITFRLSSWCCWWVGISSFPWSVWTVIYRKHWCEFASKHEISDTKNGKIWDLIKSVVCLNLLDHFKTKFTPVPEWTHTVISVRTFVWVVRCELRGYYNF